MAHLFNKSFFRFLLGFLAILALSLSIIMGARVYENQQLQEAANCLEQEGDISINC